MKRATRKLLVLAVVFLGLGLFAAPQAEAGCWYGYCGWGYDCCYSPCWTPVCAPVCSVSVCDPCCGGWYVGVRPGPIRRALFGPYRAYWGYSSCSVCCVDPCCCYVDSVVSVDSDSGVQATQKPTLAPPQDDQPAPAAPAPRPAPPAGTPNAPSTPGPAASETFAPEPPPSTDVPLGPGPGLTDPPAAPTSPSDDSLIPDPSVPDSLLNPVQPDPYRGTELPANEGTLSMLVPENARVTINGYVTKSTGRVRRYVARDLKPGFVYPFNIRVDVLLDGRTVTETRHVELTGGALEAVVFDFNKARDAGRLAQAR